MHRFRVTRGEAEDLGDDGQDHDRPENIELIQEGFDV
jgi:hypothetical protein